jgi:hypothetical protein
MPRFVKTNEALFPEYAVKTVLGEHAADVPSPLILMVLQLSSWLMAAERGKARLSATKKTIFK